MEPYKSTPAPGAATSTAAPRRRVLFVDLEGGLLAANLDWEAVVSSIRADGWAAFWIPLAALGGKQPLRRQLLERAALDIEALPYRTSVLEFARRRRAEGWQIVLVAAAPLARQVAQFVGLFDDLILVPEGAAGPARARAIEAHCHEQGCDEFTHLGGSDEDLAVWAGANEAVVVAPSHTLENRVRELGRPTIVLDPGSREQSWTALGRAMRPHHWVKNLLIFAPVVFHHSFTDARPWLASGLAFVLFCFSCSAVYILNDLLDLQSDRSHPSKRNRPFAAGKVSVRQGLIAAFSMLLVVGGISLATLPLEFSLVLGGYLLLNVLYTTWLKRKVMIDILVLASFYSLRLLAGGAATGILLSEWLIALSMFLFLSLAFLKRHGELLRLRGEGVQRTDNRGYRVQDLDMIETLGATSGYLAVLVLALYINADDVERLYAHPRVLWLVCPALLYWISRLWIWARRGVLAEDPLMFALRDRVSWLTLLVIVLLAVLAL